MSDAILRITDGTTTIDLLSRLTEPGYHLQSWNPSLPFYKGGGTFQESSLSWGRTIVDKQFENVIDTFDLKANDVNQDGLILVLQDLRRLLEKASSYWVTDWQDEPVWIEARASQETNTRYGHIVVGRIPQDGNPYTAPFLQPDCSAVMQNLQLIIEHLPWAGGEPGVGESMPIGQAVTYNGVTFGNVNSSQVLTPTTAEEAYRVNHRIETNLTHIFVDDGGVFGPNLLGAALPYALFPAVPAVGDSVYFGTDTTVADSGPFWNLVFDIGTVAAGFSYDFQVWNGGGWAPITGLGVRDNTNKWQNPGVNALMLTAERMVVASWTIRAINGVTGYWLRANVTATPGPITVPTQQNRNPYVCTWPYIEVQAADIPGELSTLVKSEIIERNEYTSSEDIESRFFILGSRSVARGNNFTAYINFADEQNPTNITVATAGGSAFQTYLYSPTGRVIQHVSGGTIPFTTIATVTISSPLTQEYYGKYRMYVRAGSFNSLVGRTVRAIIESTTGGRVVTTEATSGLGSFVYSPLETQYVDLGTVTLEGTSKLSINDSIDSITISIQVATDVNRTTDLFDMILMPVDEFAIQVFVDGSTNGLEQGEQIVIDSIEYPKIPIRTYKETISTGLISGFWDNIAPYRSVIQSNARQRMWIFNGMLDPSDDAFTYFESVHRVLMSKQQRYLSMRGSR